MKVERAVDQLTLENKRIQRQNKISERRMVFALPNVGKSMNGDNEAIIEKKISAMNSYAASPVAPSELDSIHIDMKESSMDMSVV